MRSIVKAWQVLQVILALLVLGVVGLVRLFKRTFGTKSPATPQTELGADPIVAPINAAPPSLIVPPLEKK